MQNAESSVAVLPGRPAEIHCEPLSEFDRTDRESVRRAFQSAVACPFEQAWLPETEPGFSPGEVRLGWRGGSLLVFAELIDMDIFNRATELNQPLWKLGDVFEMLFKSVDMENYVEFQVAPQNQRLQLHYPDAGAVERMRKSGGFSGFLIRNKVFHSKTWIEPELNRWQVYAEIPARVVCASNKPMENTQWRFSFGRYDYTRGVTEPVISSTSSHAKPDFHRQHEWGLLTINNSLVIVNR